MTTKTDPRECDHDPAFARCSRCCECPTCTTDREDETCDVCGLTLAPGEIGAEACGAGGLD